MSLLIRAVVLWLMGPGIFEPAEMLVFGKT
jgi:hypothetical protein